MSCDHIYVILVKHGEIAPETIGDHETCTERNQMAPLAQNVINDALSLPPVDRASLIEELLASFDRRARTSIDAGWAKEAELRIEAFEAGETSAITLDESRERINRR
jgi:putative addiction module component (TIGR02574 family)